MPPLFPVLPEDLSALTRDELTELRAAHLAAIDKIEKGEVEYTIEDLTAGVAALEQIKARQVELADEDAAVEQTTADLLERARAAAADTTDEPAAETETLAATDDEPDEDADKDKDKDADEDLAADTDADPAEPATADEPVATDTTEEPSEVTASAKRRRRRPPEPSARHRAAVAGADDPAVLIASHGIDGIQGNRPVVTRAELGELIANAARQFTARSGEQKVVVASAQVTYPEERQLLHRGATDENGAKIKAITGDRATGRLPGGGDAMLASGGLCAPLTPIYDLPILSDADTPVWDGLPKFQATRGGITFPTPIGLATARGAITRVTVEDDEQGGTFATKGCLVVDCDPFQEAVIDAIAGCVEWGNIGSMAWPERVANVADLVDVAHAEETEIGLLNALSDGSTQVNADAEYGATASLLRHMLLAAAAYRSRHRMRPERSLRVLLPALAVDMLVADTNSGQFDRFERSQAGVEALLRAFRLEPSFYMDSEDGGEQTFGAQTAGVLIPWPLAIKWFLYAEGTWIGLDMGRLDLGIIRDSGLIEQNDFRVFMETFIGIAKTGIESIEVTSTVCPDGTVAAPATAIACATA